MAGVALLYIAFNAINLEPPSDVSRLKAEAKIREMLAPSAHERIALSEKKKASGELMDEEQIKRKRKRRKHGPNPLSCKKKHKKLVDVEPSEKKTRKRKRKHVKKLAST